MNTFGVTIFTVIVLNILIRQVMINLVAIFMHNDYHNAKLLFVELTAQREEIENGKINNETKKKYEEYQKLAVQ